MPADDVPDGSGSALTRRRFLAWSAASAVLAACEVGLDYVSCSPFRVPVARLEAGRAAAVSPKGSDSR